MGVAGSGKTTIGQLLARRLQWNFADADDYHPPANVDKMSAGQPLTDEDRTPWLSALSAMIQNWINTGQSTVLACSALRASYRNILQSNNKSVAMVYLKGDFELFQKRLSGRTGHFMKSTMLTSQFQTLEEPDDVCAVDAAKDPVAIVDDICRFLKLS